MKKTLSFIAIAFIFWIGGGATHAFAAPVLLTSTKIVSPTGTGGTTPGIDTTGATLLVITMVEGNTGNSPPTDSKGNTWIPLTRQSATFGGVIIYYAIPTAGTSGTGHTFTSTSVSGNLFVAAFSGTAASPLDVQTGAVSNAATSAAPGTLTPAQNGELVISAYSIDSVRTVSVPAGYINIQESAFIGGTSYGGGMAYQVQTTALGTNPNRTWTSAANAGAAAVSFKASVTTTPTVQAKVIVLSKMIINGAKVLF